MVSYRLFLVLLLVIVCFSQQKTQPKLIFIQEIFRHGARYPEQVKNIGDQFVKQEQLLGVLTDEGRSMHYLLGKQLYQRYWKKLFGGTPYEHTYNQSRFFVKSTNVHRTIQSVQSQLYGILESLPPLELTQEQVQFSTPPYPGVNVKAGPVFGEQGRKYRPMAVHTEVPTSDPTKSGDFLYAFDGKFCPKQHQWKSYNNNNSSFTKEVYSNKTFLAALKALSLALSNNTNETLVDFGNFQQYYDNLVCLKYLGRPVPDLINQPSETKRALEFIYSINTNIVFTLNDTQINATATPFFRETIQNIHRTIQDENSPDWVIYSAQDATLSVLMRALRLWSAECIYKNYFANVDNPDDCITTFPIFATIMVFQVYKYDQYSQSNTQIYYSSHKSQPNDPLYTIKINYNGEYKKIPFCDYKYECQVKAFEEWVDSWAVKNFRQACGVYQVPEYQQQLRLIQIGTILTILLCSTWFLLLNRQVKNIMSSSLRGVLEYLGVLDPLKAKKY